MLAADAVDLGAVVAAVGEVKAAPLLHGKRSEHLVGGGAAIAEEGFAFLGDAIEQDEFGAQAVEQLGAGADADGAGGGDGGWGDAAAREVAKAADEELAEPLGEVGDGARYARAIDAFANGRDGFAVGKEEMIRDLLDTPAIEGVGGFGLGLGGVKRGECAKECRIQTAEVLVHVGRVRLSVLGMCEFGIYLDLVALRSWRARRAALAFSPSGSSLR